MADRSPPGTRPTLEDVARVAGVSRATVSRVVNGKRDVGNEIQESVRSAIAATGYVPNRAARSLATQRAGTVVVVVSGAGAPVDGTTTTEVDFTDPFFGRVVGGLLRALRPQDINPVLMLAETDADRARVMAFVRGGNAEGALFVTTQPDDPLPEMFGEARLPLVMFARPVKPIPVNFVDVAHRDGAALAAAHLVSLGRRSIVTISGPLAVPAAQDRLSGFRDALARHGQAYVPTATGDFSFESGAEAMRSLLAEVPDLDGVFAANDHMALAAMGVLEESGRRVPQDVAVIGFDDSAIAALTRPGLTSVRQPFEEMAAAMVRILLGQLADPTRRVSSVIFEPTLTVRGSA
ncbi:MAG: LacI family transcriptional regulator [Cellulomonas sp.]|uniref:LacI family DNA-binding transcriptional regulator n=1 Tax=Cellulomonas sp. TaxID=40001 RepID=UPI00183A025E|nr:LacI family DNA-binding transcriptional regulator [Cellulomonas sp.]NMM17961.1 LacI family transcriptional regulator [Cellulomonas sp.]NMM31690.1 LacI family transcriptional regulator [Cellulomonas sp.]